MNSFLLLNVKGILRDSFKIFNKNGRLMFYVAASSLCITSLLYLSNFFSIKPLITDLLIDQYYLTVTDPNSSQFSNLITRSLHDLRLFLGVELLYFVVNTMAFTLLATATILVSAISHGDNNYKDFYFEDLVSKTILKPWMRVLVTQVSNGVFDVCFIALFVFILTPVLVIIQHPHTKIAACLLFGIIAVVLYLIVVVIWNLAMVVSTIEEIRGLSAFVKASELVKGLKKEGFLLNLGFAIMNLILVQGMKLFPQKAVADSVAVYVVMGLVLVNVTTVANMLRQMAFTVFYYQCKKTHGEAIELQGIIGNGYSKIPDAASLINQDIP